jgi:hypothetical protein
LRRSYPGAVCLNLVLPTASAVEKSIYGAEAQNLGFGPTGGGAVEARTDLAQGRVSIVPESARLVVTDEAARVRVAGPIESAAEFGGDGRHFMSVHVAAFRQALAALYCSPETTVGEAIVRFRRVEILCEFALRDVGDQADMRAGCLDGVETIERAEIAAIPGATEQGGEVTLVTPRGMENGGEFLRERKQTTVRGRLLITQAIDKRSGRQASGGDAFGDPGMVDFREEAADLVPACSLAGLAGFADQHHEKVETMAGGIAERGQKLQEDGSGMGLAVRGQAAYGQSRDAVECGIAEDWFWDCTGRSRVGGAWRFCICGCVLSCSGFPVSSNMRRSMSDRVGKDGPVIPSIGLDFMICLLHDFELKSKLVGQLALL